jgi:uncharacterized protein (TIGR02284 family)
MPNKKSIEVLNLLIQINNDRIEGYKTATKETEEENFKSLFSKLKGTSQKCREELIAEVRQLGGTLDEGTNFRGKFFLLWMGVKAAMTGKDGSAIIDSCEYGESVVVNTYKRALVDYSTELTSGQQKMISEQSRLIAADHYQVKTLQYALKNIYNKKAEVN